MKLIHSLPFLNTTTSCSVFKHLKHILSSFYFVQIKYSNKILNTLLCFMFRSASMDFFCFQYFPNFVRNLYMFNLYASKQNLFHCILTGSFISNHISPFFINPCIFICTSVMLFAPCFVLLVTSPPSYTIQC